MSTSNLISPLISLKEPIFKFSKEYLSISIDPSAYADEYQNYLDQERITDVYHELGGILMARIPLTSRTGLVLGRLVKNHIAWMEMSEAYGTRHEISIADWELMFKNIGQQLTTGENDFSFKFPIIEEAQDDDLTEVDLKLFSDETGQVLPEDKIPEHFYGTSLTEGNTGPLEGVLTFSRRGRFAEISSFPLGQTGDYYVLDPKMYNEIQILTTKPQLQMLCKYLNRVTGGQLGRGKPITLSVAQAVRVYNQLRAKTRVAAKEIYFCVECGRSATGELSAFRTVMSHVINSFGNVCNCSAPWGLLRPPGMAHNRENKLLEFFLERTKNEARKRKFSILK